MTTSPDQTELNAQQEEHQAVNTAPDKQEQFEAELSRIERDLEPWTNAIHESERLGESDFAVRINAKD